jgi:hypothetical protein
LPAQPLANFAVVRVLGHQRYLALSLLAFLCIAPFTHDRADGSRLLTYAVLTLVFITGPLAVARTRGQLIATVVLALLVLLPGLASARGQFEEAYRYSLLAGILFFSFLAGLLIREFLIEDTEVNSETLWGAVNIYILIGLCFAFWYAALSLFIPGLFSGNFMVEPHRNQLMGFVYFSFVTLTTLGYGDITPSVTWVATLSYLEAVIGQLYVAIVIARLVSLYLAKRD